MGVAAEPPARRGAVSRWNGLTRRRKRVPGAMDTAAQSRKWRETVMFFVLAVLIWPFLASAFVGAYGLAFWIWFRLNGPPGPR